MFTRLGSIVLIAAVLPACAGAPRAQVFPELPRYIEAGKTVEITDVNGETTRGTLTSLSPTSLAILADGIRHEVADRDVVRVTKRVRRVGRGALLGLTAGIMAGLAMPHPKPPEYAIVAVQGAAIDVAACAVLGTVVGAVGGAILKGTKTVYEAPAGSGRTRHLESPPHGGDLSPENQSRIDFPDRVKSIRD